MYGGLSSGLSLLQISLDLQQAEVIKGANPTLYGGGAIAGLINLVDKPGSEREIHAFQRDLCWWSGCKRLLFIPSG